MIESGYPPMGTKWVRRRDGHQETRHVVDTTLGGNIVYFSGRLPRDFYRQHGLRCTIQEWYDWDGVRVD